MLTKERKQNAWQVGALIVTGVGIGGLVGLSASPVVSIVITSVTGSAAAVVAALSGLKSDAADKPSPWKIDPMPLGLLVLGLITGSLGRLYLWTHNALSPNALTLTEEITQWTTAGLAQDIGVTKLFVSKSPSSTSSSTGKQMTVPFPASVLVSEEAQGVGQTLTILVMKQNDDDLRTELRSSAVPSFRTLPTIVTDTVKLAQIVEKVLCPDTAPS